MKKIFLALLLTLLCPTITNGPDAIDDPVMNPCIQRSYLTGCGTSGLPTPQRVYKVPNRWGAICVNPVNVAIGYSENNTEGYRSTNKEALTNCIKAGGGKNPIANDDKGYRRMTKVRNFCNAVAIGGAVGSGGTGIKSDDNLKRARQKALTACSECSDKCVTKYSDCSRHPDYRVD